MGKTGHVLRTLRCTAGDNPLLGAFASLRLFLGTFAVLLLMFVS
jgi:hypothetical protein